MCQDLWEALGKQRWMIHKLRCQRSQLMTKTIIVWMRFCRVGWTKSHKSTEKGVFWLGAEKILSEGLQDFEFLRVRRVLLEEWEAGEAFQRYWHVQRYRGMLCGWNWMRQNRERRLVRLCQKLKWSNEFPSLGGESGRQVLRWHPVINSLV